MCRRVVFSHDNVKLLIYFQFSSDKLYWISAYIAEKYRQFLTKKHDFFGDLFFLNNMANGTVVGATVVAATV